MNMPKVSMIIPVYNAEKYLERCIASVQAQSFADFEALFIDDLSTDSSREIIREYQKNDPRIRLIELEKNGGSGIARNIGIENARGEYLSFIDADDTVSPGFLKYLYEKAKETGADVVSGTRVDSFDGGYRRASPRRAARAGRDHSAKPYAGFIKEHWIAIYRRGLINKHSIRYGETRVSHDIVFLLQVGYFAESFALAPEAEYYYFDNDGSAVHTFSYERFRASMLSVGEMVDFINKTDPFSTELTSFLSGFLMRQLPVHSYLCTQPELRDKAPEFLEELRGTLLRFKNLNGLTSINYAVRAVIELNENENVSPVGIIFGLKRNVPWRLYSFEKLVEHVNSERADQAAAAKHLCSALSNIERRLLRDEENMSEERLGEFYKKLHGILLKLSSADAFIECGGPNAKAMLEYGVNLFCLTVNDPLEDTAIKIGILKRTLDLIEAHPEVSRDHAANAEGLSFALLRRLSRPPLSSCEKREALFIELSEQIKRMNALC